MIHLRSSNEVQSGKWYPKMKRNSIGSWLLLITCGSLGIAAVAVAQTQIQSNFENGSISPFSTEVCCGNSISVINTLFPARSGSRAVQLKWYQKNYQGNRITRGVEVTTRERGSKETWFGFSFYLPDREFPRDKSLIIAQQNAWHQSCQTDKSTVLYVSPKELGIHGYSGYGFKLNGRVGGALTTNIPRDRWVDVVIHTVFSRSKKGMFEVWFDGAPANQPTLKLTNINIGTGCWSGDTLNYGQYAKLGIYAWDATNYTIGESRTIYFDNVTYLTSGHAGGFSLVNPVNLRRLTRQRSLNQRKKVDLQPDPDRKRRQNQQKRLNR